MLSLSKYDTVPPFDGLRVTRLGKGLFNKTIRGPAIPVR